MYCICSPTVYVLWLLDSARTVADGSYTLSLFYALLFWLNAETLINQTIAYTFIAAVIHFSLYLHCLYAQTNTLLSIVILSMHIYASVRMRKRGIR